MKSFRPAAIALAVATVSLAAVAAESAPAGDAARVERGRYIVTTSGCNDCHTPWQMGPNGPEPDMSRMLSGHPREMELPPPPPLSGPWIMTAAATNTAWAGPWGISFTANLTSDKATGVGNWTEQEFLDTLRSGRHLGRGRQILPPMPWTVYGQMTDEDLGAIFAFLQTVPPISNKVPDPLPPAPAPAP
ncbi:MAG: diheme cytochrome c-553 [Thermoanaerobaculia bacterium]|nr:diheme cytochrome c-553 [Thermoanaerobaculia bacterium]